MFDPESVPGWTVLLAGVLLGHSGLLHDGLAPWNTFMEAIIVPLYGLCVFMYLGKMVLETYLSSKSSGAIRTRLSDTVNAGVGTKQPPVGTRAGVKGDATSSPSVAAVSETSTLSTAQQSSPTGGTEPVDMNGSYLLVSNVGFEAFLEVQGVPWALRRAANQARPIHQIIHRGKSVTIQIKGIIESQTTYEIDGPPVETSVRGRVFRDQMTYLESGDGIKVSKTAVTENYDITVTRRLTPDRQTINMTSTAIFHDGRPPVESFQIFERI